MADTKISGLTAGSAVADTDVFPAVETTGAGPVKKTAAQLKTYIGAAAPAGSGSELQYRSSGTAFGALSGSSVSGANLSLGGTLRINSADMRITSDTSQLYFQSGATSHIPLTIASYAAVNFSGEVILGWTSSAGDATGGSVDVSLARVAAGVLGVTGVIVTSAPVVASLPAAATAGVGARGFVTDANATTFNSIVAGGGTNKVPVFSDGTNWRIG